MSAPEDGPPLDGGSRAWSWESVRVGVAKLSAWRDLVPPAIFGILFLMGWELVGRQIDPILFSPPSLVAGAFWDMSVSGELLRALGQTLNAMLFGFVLAIIVAIPIGIIIGQGDRAGRVITPYINAVYAIPLVVMIPVVIVWFGVGYSGRVFLVWIGAVIPIMINTSYGVRHARPDLVEVAHAFGAGRLQLVRHVLLPGSVPYIAAGLRIGAGKAVIGIIVGEIFLQTRGLGGIIQTSAVFFRRPPMLAAVVMVGIVGSGFIGILRALENRVSAWKAG